MTSEIVLMNRQAVALAADSATTVTYWENGKRRERYFKGANKIFNISDRHPVGFMTYNVASIQGVPLEILVKTYRGELADKSYDHINEYVEDFFRFVEQNTALYSRYSQEKYLFSQANTMAMSIVASAINEKDINPKNEIEDNEKRMSDYFEEKMAAIKSEKIFPQFDEAEVSKYANQYKETVSEKLKKEEIFEIFNFKIDFDFLSEIAICGVFSIEQTPLDITGIVVTGYGDKDYFPSAQIYEVYGLLLEKLAYVKKGDTYKIDPDHVSEIIPVAQSEMVNTFIYGISDEGIHEIEKSFLSALNTYKEKICENHGFDEKIDLDKEMEESKNAFFKGVSEHIVSSHTMPLRRVVGMLPVDELAELAETLISIESLKEKVTRPSESVGGPIDVAVISKGEGFIWLKRKHYFSKELNPRYFARLAES